MIPKLKLWLLEFGTVVAFLIALYCAGETADGLAIGMVFALIAAQLLTEFRYDTYRKEIWQGIVATPAADRIDKRGAMRAAALAATLLRMV